MHSSLKKTMKKNVLYFGLSRDTTRACGTTSEHEVLTLAGWRQPGSSTARQSRKHTRATRIERKSPQAFHRIPSHSSPPLSPILQSLASRTAHKRSYLVDGCGTGGQPPPWDRFRLFHKQMARREALLSKQPRSSTPT